jgi:hypothetical protein
MNYRGGFVTPCSYIDGMIKVMTQKEYHQQINERFYGFVESNFPEYDMYDEMGGRMNLMADGKGDNSIEYHQSRHELTSLNWASEKTKSDLFEMEMYLNRVIIPNVNRLKEDLVF